MRQVFVLAVLVAVFLSPHAVAGELIEQKLFKLPSRTGQRAPMVFPKMQLIPVPQQPLGYSCARTGERVSGTNKICLYDCAGSQTATNVPYYSVCPPTIQGF
jgi:hypothetical protein